MHFGHFLFRIGSIFLPRPTALKRLSLGGNLAEVIWAALSGLLAADPTSFGDNDAITNGFTAMRAFHGSRIQQGLLAVNGGAPTQQHAFRTLPFRSRTLDLA